jgi:signal transduction histidine kinase
MRLLARRDLAIIAVLFFIVGWICARFDVSDRIIAATRPLARYQLDEAPGILLFFALAFAWFSWRRMRETERQLRARLAAERDLRLAFETNQRLARDNVRVQEEERRQIARELHDELGQSLNAIKIDAVTLRDARASPAEAERAAFSIVDVVEHVEGIVRDLIGRLRPAGLDEFGLTAAIDHLVEGWRRRMPDVRFEFVAPPDESDFGESVNITLFRMVQEGLTNAAKHARARRVEIALESRRNSAGPGGEARLTVRDDGVGRSGGAGPSGLGLIGMRERVETIGGRFDARSLSGGGFELVASIPFTRG